MLVLSKHPRLRESSTYAFQVTSSDTHPTTQPYVEMFSLHVCLKAKVKQGN
jgi:hypothetical protein